ncbi:endolytic transglycosylase MltG [Streptomyces sp. NPDC051567]|uniref:endolytic transglycosylase MltG n=1 Tax=Streptomyces sp. NPDC051567 TaxID=3365660 RepID=UPI0037A06EC4
MTEYGQGRGPEPWHPEDPLFGDQGWTGHQTQQGQAPYDTGAQQQYAPASHPQDPQYQDSHYPEQYPGQQHPGSPLQDPQYPGHQYPAPHPQDPHYQDPHYQEPQYPGQQQGYAPQYPQPQAPQQPQEYPQAQPQEYLQPQGAQQPYPAQAQQLPEQAYDGQGWQTGQAADPYAGAEPYAQQTVAAYPGEAPDPYATDGAYPPPQPPGRRHLEPEPVEEAPEEERESPLPADGDGPPSGGRRSGRSKGKGGPGKKRSRATCLVAAVVVLAVVGGGGYYGYTFVKARFGAAEDFAGAGTDESVQIEIPKNAGLGQMGRILKEHGVVASAQAFVDAAEANPKGKGIQPGVYTLKKKMSAQAAVEVMVDPSKLNVVTVPEGTRNVDVYKAIDLKLDKPAGTTQEVAIREVKNLGLPAWALNDPKVMDPLEGFLYPARYDLGKDSTPQSLLKQMVKNATDKYTELGIEGKAKGLGLENPLQVITVASLVNAEGKNHDDFRKMAEVVYNRLKKTNDVTNQKIEFDSTYNYIKGTSEINFNLTEARKLDHPYNTHFVRGLPPGPIGNPGADALTATLSPDNGGWMFFVSVDGNKTTFTKTYAEHLKLVAEFQERLKQKQENGG